MECVEHPNYEKRKWWDETLKQYAKDTIFKGKE